jgi:hypothetical protein
MGLESQVLDKEGILTLLKFVKSEREELCIGFRKRLRFNPIIGNR